MANVRPMGSCVGALTASAGLVLAALSWPVTGQEAKPPVPAAATPARAALCSACHGDASGSKLPNTPSLAGQPRIFLENTLVLIREGVRNIPSMKGLLDGVDDEEIIALSKYYTALKLDEPKGAEAQPRDDKLYARGKQVAEQNRCGTCHLPDYSGREQMPRLALQRQDYLTHSMREFQGNRAVGRDTIMAASLLGISDADVQAMAHFFAQGAK